MNWSMYNKSLVNRGDLTFYIDEEAIYLPPFNKNIRGRPRQYSDNLLLMMLIVKSRFNLTYRMLEGFIKSVFLLKNFNISTPTYSLVCKQAPNLANSLPKLSNARPLVIVLDATGIKVYGEGEWKVRTHGKSRCRKWCKIHVAIDAKTQEIITQIHTEGNVSDKTIGPNLIEKTPNSCKKVIADGAYDSQACREKIRLKNAKALIPPIKNARLTGDKDRDEAVRLIRSLGNDEMAKKCWKKLTDYGKRSLVETTFSRFKRMLGERLFSKKFRSQSVEIWVKCFLLNCMISNKRAIVY